MNNAIRKKPPQELLSLRSLKSSSGVPKIALVGAGGHGFYHLEEIHFAEASGQVRLAGIADPYLSRQPELVAALTARGIPMYADDEALLRDLEELDLLVISTPVFLHEAMVMRALRHPTVKRILLEKPPMPSLPQMKRAVAADRGQKTRIGFQMIHFPEIQHLKSALGAGRLGTLRRIIISGGWPRGDRYYARAPWAGRMNLEGEPVFDGPATNALAHLLHNALYLAAPVGQDFARPVDVDGQFYRARPIEAYDFAWLTARVDSVSLHVALAHCLDQEIPWQMIFETDGGCFILDEKTGLSGGQFPAFPRFATQTRPLYEAFLAPEETFSLSPTTLRQAIPFTTWTCEALERSGGIRSITESAVSRKGDLYVARDLTEYLWRFRQQPLPPSRSLAWANASSTASALSR